jgi:hypothetical protein
VKKVIAAGIKIDCIIFDEANSFFNSNDASVKSALDGLVYLSKQERIVSVIMATSEYGFPFRLHEISGNLKHVSEILVVGEMSPNCTRGLLREWKLRENLASALQSVYGGHVLQLYNALKQLNSCEETYQICYGFVKGFEMFVGDFIKVCEKDDVLRDKVYPLLRELAVTGFVPVDTSDEIGKLAVKYNVAGFADATTNLGWIPDEVRLQRSGLIPSLQSMRLVIARTLSLRGKL